ncbi:MAG: hypothetical protein B6226_06260 [Candidatus Cloacimonetes bacterium 4572_65]|nr:MAG: hypothetical protein B6226_06260 [Candidatus Cloacimonetes bacterium 4572_65]
MSLETIRKKIDKVDQEIIKLLAKRMELALESAQYKDKVEDSSREEVILKKLECLAEEMGLSISYLSKVYNIVFEEGKFQQRQKVK